MVICIDMPFSRVTKLLLHHATPSYVKEVKSLDKIDEGFGNEHAETQHIAVEAVEIKEDETTAQEKEVSVENISLPDQPDNTSANAKTERDAKTSYSDAGFL